jgi:hypothetical protein
MGPLEKRSGPFALEPSRTPPTKAQRDNDYRPETDKTGAAIKRQSLRDDDLGFPSADESKWG